MAIRSRVCIPEVAGELWAAHLNAFVRKALHCPSRRVDFFEIFLIGCFVAKSVLCEQFNLRVVNRSTIEHLQLVVDLLRGLR